MQQPIGELLVGRGLISPTQLQEGLKAQLVFGGRLGTNLVELGHLQDAQLADVLSVQLRTPSATAEDFESVRHDALQAISGDQASRYGVFPLRLDGNKLRLAMVDPADLDVVTELEFFTGLTIVPVVAPQGLLLEAIERLYGVERATRFIRLPTSPDDEAQPVALDNDPLSMVQPPASSLPSVLRLAEVTEPGAALSLLRDVLAYDFGRGAVLVSRSGALWGFSCFGYRGPESEFRQRSVPLSVCAALGGLPHGEMFLGTLNPAVPRSQPLLALGITPRRTLMAGPVMADGALVAVGFAEEPRAKLNLHRLDDIFRRVGWAIEAAERRARLLAPLR